MTDEEFAEIKSSVREVDRLCFQRSELQRAIECAEYPRDVHIPHGFDWGPLVSKPDPERPVLKIDRYSDLGCELIAAVLPFLRNKLAEVDRELEAAKKKLTTSPKTKHRRKK